MTFRWKLKRALLKGLPFPCKVKTSTRSRCNTVAKLCWHWHHFIVVAILHYPAEDALVSKSSSLLTSATKAVHLSFSLSSVTGSMGCFFSSSLALIRPIKRITKSHNLEIILQCFQSSLLHCFGCKEKAQVLGNSFFVDSPSFVRIRFGKWKSF